MGRGLAFGQIVGARMTELRASAEWRLFCLNWIPIGAMGATLALCLVLTDFSIRWASAALPLGAAALYAGVAYYNAYAPHKRDPLVVFVLGATAQVVLITLLMTPLTYVAAAANLPMMDAGLNDLDRALGLDWRAYFLFIYHRPQLITAAVLGYGLIGIPVFGIPILLGFTRHFRRLQEFTFAFGLSLVATAIISALIPAIGTYDLLGIRPDPAIFTPGSYLDQLRDLPLVRDGSLRELDIPKLAGIITFPSFHAAAAVLYLWACWAIWWMRPPALIINAGMLLATPVGGGHYFVDVFAGMAVAVLAIATGRWIGNRLTRPAFANLNGRSPLPAPSVLQVGTLGLGCAQNGDDRQHGVDHHQEPDIEISVAHAVDAQNLSGNDRNQPAAVDLRDLIPGAGAGSAKAGRKVFGVERRDGAITEAEHEAEADDLGDGRQDEAAGVDEIKIRHGEHQEYACRD